MSSAWRATGVILPVASVSVTVMWSVLNPCADGAGEPIANTVATSSARRIRRSSAAGAPMSTLEPGHGVRPVSEKYQRNHPVCSNSAADCELYDEPPD